MVKHVYLVRLYRKNYGKVAQWNGQMCSVWMAPYAICVNKHKFNVRYFFHLCSVKMPFVDAAQIWLLRAYSIVT